MLPQQIKIFIFIYLLVFNSSFSAGQADHNFKGGMELTKNTPNDQVMVMNVMKGRKLLIKVDAMLDYQGPGANPVHDPRKGN